MLPRILVSSRAPPDTTARAVSRLAHHAQQAPTRRLLGVRCARATADTQARVGDRPAQLNAWALSFLILAQAKEHSQTDLKLPIHLLQTALGLLLLAASDPF